ncbi:hypothetical protein CDAR_46941 [Caerostris darwini]|uniref:Uncharacterized protein n=1 Tax=Caerostris darwini TaxID=1538125 RepID=A0AAV4S7F6_9ARAC|nr:hypothetical protein CDAR_46941 [Caerostris darwini]
MTARNGETFHIRIECIRGDLLGMELYEISQLRSIVPFQRSFDFLEDPHPLPSHPSITAEQIGKGVEALPDLDGFQVAGQSGPMCHATKGEYGIIPTLRSTRPLVFLSEFLIVWPGNRRSFVLLFELMDTSIRLRVVHIPASPSLGISSAGTLDSHLFSACRL